LGAHLLTREGDCHGGTGKYEPLRLQGFLPKAHPFLHRKKPPAEGGGTVGKKKARHPVTVHGVNSLRGENSSGACGYATPVGALIEQFPDRP